MIIHLPTSNFMDLSSIPIIDHHAHSLLREQPREASRLVLKGARQRSPAVRLLQAGDVRLERFQGADGPHDLAGARARTAAVDVEGNDTQPRRQLPF